MKRLYSQLFSLLCEKYLQPYLDGEEQNRLEIWHNNGPPEPPLGLGTRLAFLENYGPENRAIEKPVSNELFTGCDG